MHSKNFVLHLSEELEGEAFGLEMFSCLLSFCFCCSFDTNYIVSVVVLFWMQTNNIMPLKKNQTLYAFTAAQLTGSPQMGLLLTFLR